MKLPAILAALITALALTIYITPIQAHAAAFVLNETEITRSIETDGEAYARIFSENTYIYSDTDCRSGIFIIPQTYYVKVVNYSPDVCRIIYCFEDYDYARAVYGYVLTENLTFVSDPPNGRSFPNVFAEFEGKGTFYKNTRFDSFYPSAETADEITCFFYGYYMRGREKYCYVLSGGKFGYYSADVFADIQVSAHPDPKPVYRQTQSSPDSSQKPTENFFSSDTNKVIFIAVSCIIAVSAVYLIFLPKRKKEPLPGEDEDE